MTQRVQGLSKIIEHFDAVATDQYGVLHDGVQAFPGAQAALEALAQRQIPLVTLTNSGKRASSNVTRLARLGFDPRTVGTVISSGELARAELARLSPGTNVLLLTRDGETELVDGLDLRPVKVHEADAQTVVVLAGLRPETTPRDEYARMLRSLARAGARLLLVNPDKLIGHGNDVFFGPGAVAEDYANAGGNVLPLGKPARAMFEAALARLGNPRPDRVLMIGDSPDHDIGGAKDAGMQTLLIEGGVQSRLDGRSPDYVAARLCW